MTSRQVWHTSTYIAYLSNNPFELYTAKLRGMTSRQAWHTSTYIAYLSNNPFELYTAFPYTLTFISMFFFFF